MNGKVAKYLRKEANLKDINKARDDATYMLSPTSSFRFTRRLKDGPLKRYKRAKQMFKDPYMKEFIT